MPSFIKLEKILFSGPGGRESSVTFKSGVNVVCGASDTGKSFLAESIDYMLGGTSLREIPERTNYDKITLDLLVGDDEKWTLERSTAGGDLSFQNSISATKPSVIKHVHRQDKIDNLSGLLLEKLGLLSKRILRNKDGATQGLSFRNVARLIVVQEGEIQQLGSPFWSGQFTTKTSDQATVKLLLTGVDDSSVSVVDPGEVDNSKQIGLVEELIAEVTSELGSAPPQLEQVEDQYEKLAMSIHSHRDGLIGVQTELNIRVQERRQHFEERKEIEERLDEVSELLLRFDLLEEHYKSDIERLSSIQESGSLFAGYPSSHCPLCGAAPQDQHPKGGCDADVESIVEAATSEIQKISVLRTELTGTISDLGSEQDTLRARYTSLSNEINRLNNEIEKAVAPRIAESEFLFSELLDRRAEVKATLDLLSRSRKLTERRDLLMAEKDQPQTASMIVTGIPDSVAHQFSKKLSTVLQAWDFPGECQVHFDKSTGDFVIDGKPRGSRGKGLRAITHAAVTVALLEYCQEHHLPHPGFVVLDSPLLAYFKPEGDEDKQLQGTNLKEQFYKYLIDHHKTESQIIIIENQHPPSSVEDRISLTVFTGNPNEGRFGLLQP